MKRALIGILALAGMITTASAADLSRRYEPVTKAPAYAPVMYTWTGPYIGLNAGGGWGKSDWTGVGSTDVRGGLIGAQAGYNWQMNQLVLGVEGDIAWTNIDGSSSVPAFGIATRNTWLGTIRGRLGVAMDRFMPYVTGGAAFGNIKAQRPFFTGSDQTEAGWTIGAGVEFALAPNWTAKAEYLYVDLGKNNCGLSCNAPVGSSVDFTANILRAGINYRF